MNDNSPVFDQPSYEASIPEAAELGTSVLRVQARDMDVGDNARYTGGLGNNVSYTGGLGDNVYREV